MLQQLIAYNAQGSVVATLDHMVAKDEDGNVVGLIDFEAHEQAGGRMRDIWENSEATGSGTWPEWLGGGAYAFRVELDPSPGPSRARIAALVHKTSGHRRERYAIEAAIAERLDAARQAARAKGDEQRARLRSRGVREEVVEQFADPAPEPVDLRDLLGGPGRPLQLDEDGRTLARVQRERPALPVIARGRRA